MPKPQLIAVGDNCLDVYLSKNEMSIGGNALNVAVQWHNLGCHSCYFGAVGQDEEGRLVLSAVEQAGLDATDVEIREGATALTLIAIQAGERRFLTESLGVGADYFPSRYQDLLACDFVHLGTHANRQLVRRLVEDGQRFSIDLSNHPFDDLNLAGVELVFASGGEKPHAIPSLLEKIRQQGGQKILITCGADGAYYHDGGQMLHMPAQPVDVVDTCGAGDAYLARFVLAAFFEEQTILAALAAATAYAGEICTHQGGFIQPIQPIPDWLYSKYTSLL